MENSPFRGTALFSDSAFYLHTSKAVQWTPYNLNLQHPDTGSVCTPVTLHPTLKRLAPNSRCGKLKVKSHCSNFSHMTLVYVVWTWYCKTKPLLTKQPIQDVRTLCLERGLFFFIVSWGYINLNLLLVIVGKNASKIERSSDYSNCAQT